MNLAPKRPPYGARKSKSRPGTDCDQSEQLPMRVVVLLLVDLGMAVALAAQASPPAQ